MRDIVLMQSSLDIDKILRGGGSVLICKMS